MKLKQKLRLMLLGTAAAWLIVPRFHAPAGPYAPAAGRPGSTAIAAGDASIVAWGSLVGDVQRGTQNIGVPAAAATTFGVADNVLGRANATPANPNPVFSLGDGGSITVLFDHPITNGAGADFAVFENGFTDSFLELAFVDVSSDGIHFFRFPSISLTPTEGLVEDLNIDDFRAIDPTNINNLAGKYRAGYGTPFDLEELSGVLGLDIFAITAVRITDAVGSINPRYGSLDSLGNLIVDPFPTEDGTSAGFDLDAIGVIHQTVPEPGATALLLTAAPFLLRRRGHRG